VIILSGVLVVVAIALLVAGIVAGNGDSAQVFGLDALVVIYVSIAVSIVSALCLAIGVFLRRRELFGGGATPTQAKKPKKGKKAAPAKTPAKAKAPAAKDEPEAANDEVQIPAPPANVPDDAPVFVVRGRKRYHLDTCRQLAGRDKEELTYVEAKEEGFSPCTACLPDTALAARAAVSVPAATGDKKGLAGLAKPGSASDTAKTAELPRTPPAKPAGPPKPATPPSGGTAASGATTAPAPSPLPSSPPTPPIKAEPATPPVTPKPVTPKPVTPSADAPRDITSAAAKPAPAKEAPEPVDDPEPGSGPLPSAWGAPTPPAPPAPKLESETAKAPKAEPTVTDLPLAAAAKKAASADTKPEPEPSSAAAPRPRESEDSGPAKPASDEGPQVRILSGTKRYHRTDCALIEDIGDEADDLEALSRAEAKARGCTPCLVCQPDKEHIRD